MNKLSVLMADSERKRLLARLPHVAVVPYKTLAGQHRALTIAWLQRHVGARGFDWDSFPVNTKEPNSSAVFNVCFRDAGKAVLFKLRWANVDA